jgi:transposase InsO family protein
MIDRIHHQTGAPVRTICQVLQCPRSSYYHAAVPTRSQVDDQRFGELIEAIFHAHKARYGHRRIRFELLDHGIGPIGRERVRRLMKERGLRAIGHRPCFLPRTSDGKAHSPSPNLLMDRPLPERPNQVWTSDITYIPTAQGWVYLAVIIDLYSRRVVGWHLADHLRAELVQGALHQALETRGRRHPGLIFHSDRGSQYSANAVRQQLALSGIAQSMSARANPYDNAWTESFMGTLKTEIDWPTSRRFEDIHHARSAVFEFIDGYYNTRRKHSALGYQSPSQAERNQPLKALN